MSALLSELFLNNIFLVSIYHHISLALLKLPKKDLETL